MINFHDNTFKTLESSKIPKMFRNAQTVAFGADKDGDLTAGRVLRENSGLLAGTLLPNLANATGATVGLHEVVGHGLLGSKLTSQSSNPTYQVDGWDRFHEMAQAGSFKTGLINFFKWIVTPSEGVTHGARSGEPNGLGQSMGTEGRSAWISLSGSIPGLALDTLSVTGGMHLRKRSPILGNMMVSFGLVDNLMNATYPLSAALMSESEMEKQSKSGHDFANFAVQMNAVTGISAQDIAISTAAFWMGFVPLVAGATYLHTKSHVTDVIPNVLALQHWVQKAETDPEVAKQLEKYYQAYPKKEQLLTIKEENLYANPILIDFVNYLLEELPPKTLDASKTEILASWEKNLPKDRIQTALTTATVVGLAAAVASKALSFLALTTSSLQTAATILSYISPIFIGASVLSAGYQVYKDFKCPDSTVPKSAKMLSVAHLVMTIACAALIVAVLFLPGVNFIFLGAIMLSCIANIILSYKRSQIIRKQFALSKALSPEVWNVMYPLWHNYKKKLISKGKTLTNWTDRVSKKVNLYEFLTPLDIHKILNHHH